MVTFDLVHAGTNGWLAVAASHVLRSHLLRGQDCAVPHENIFLCVFFFWGDSQPLFDFTIAIQGLGLKAVQLYVLYT